MILAIILAVDLATTEPTPVVITEKERMALSELVAKLRAEIEKEEARAEYWYKQYRKEKKDCI